MKKKQVEKEQNNEKQLPRQETTLGEDIFQLLLKKEMERSFISSMTSCFFSSIYETSNKRW